VKVQETYCVIYWIPSSKCHFDSNRNNNCPTKLDIERAFRIAAIRYHPDTAASSKSKSKNDDADTDHTTTKQVIQFRQCLEARDLLLNHFYNVNRGQRYQRIITTQQSDNNNNNNTRRPFNYSPYYSWNRKDSKNTILIKGFPVLTTRGKICIKGGTAILILTMGMYDGYIRNKNKKAIRNK